MPSVSITTSATKIVSDNPKRMSLVIQNESTTQTVYVGVASTVTASGTAAVDGVGIQPGGTLTEDVGSGRGYKGPYYAIVSANTADIRYWERNT